MMKRLEETFNLSNIYFGFQSILIDYELFRHVFINNCIFFKSNSTLIYGILSDNNLNKKTSVLIHNCYFDSINSIQLNFA